MVNQSGTKSFHGSAGLNANNWMNNRDNIPRPSYVPTQLERQGDFSQSVDQNGAKVTIRDYTTGSPFNGNVIPASQRYGPGIAALNLFRLPNVSRRKGYNYQSQISSSEPRHEQLLRLDYTATEKWPFTGSLTHLAREVFTSVYCPSGYSPCPNFPLTPTQYDHPGYILTISATTSIRPTLINEAMFDIAHHPVSVLPEDSTALTRAKTGVTLPMLFPLIRTGFRT